MPTLIGSVCPGSHDLNDSNRPVRTRMPGGVGGERSGNLAAPIPIYDATRELRADSCGYASPSRPLHARAKTPYIQLKDAMRARRYAGPLPLIRSPQEEHRAPNNALSIFQFMTTAFML
ncbi:protein of unknown function [Thauera humireducens]|nr:protein of unknown function [Thauera humireducens]